MAKKISDLLKQVERKETVKVEKKKKNFESSFVTQAEIVEQIYVDGIASYLVYTNPDIKILATYTYRDKEYEPIVDDCLEQGVVILPTQAIEYESEAALIEEIKQHIHKYVDVPSDFQTISAWYILLTWVYDKISTLPYLRVMGDTGCGKSRFQDIVGRLCYKPCQISGAVTPAPIYRVIKKWKGTLIIDEADFKASDEKQEVVKILNCGFERRRPVLRCTKDDPDNLQSLPTFCPKIIGTRGTFEDKALESRCLTNKMTQTARKDIPFLLPEDFYVDENNLRSKLLMFRFKNLRRIDIRKAQGLDLGNVEPRLQQVTASFAVIFAHDPNLMDMFRAFLAQYNKDLIEERAGTKIGEIANALLFFYGVGQVGLEKREVSVGDLTNYIKEEYNHEKLSTSFVGRKIKELGFSTKQTRINSKVHRMVIWDDALIQKIKERYFVEDCGVAENVAEKKATATTMVEGGS